MRSRVTAPPIRSDDQSVRMALNEHLIVRDNGHLSERSAPPIRSWTAQYPPCQFRRPPTSDNRDIATILASVAGTVGYGDVAVVTCFLYSLLGRAWMYISSQAINADFTQGTPTLFADGDAILLGLLRPHPPAEAILLVAELTA